MGLAGGVLSDDGEDDFAGFRNFRPSLREISLH